MCRWIFRCNAKKTPMQLKTSSTDAPDGPSSKENSFGSSMTVCGRCPETGQMGYASASSEFAVGAGLGYVRSASGLSLIQGASDPEFHRKAHQALTRGEEPKAALIKALSANPQAKHCQSFVLAPSGVAHVLTGSQLTKPSQVLWSGALASENSAVGGAGLNLETVVPAIMAKFKQTARTGLLLSERLLASLERGLEVAGDMPNLRAGALYVMGEDRYPLIDLRVDDNRNPLPRLRTLFEDYMRDDIKLDAYLPTKDDPFGLAPTTVDEASRFIKRWVRHTLKAIGR